MHNNPAVLSIPGTPLHTPFLCLDGFTTARESTLTANGLPPLPLQAVCESFMNFTRGDALLEQLASGDSVKLYSDESWVFNLTANLVQTGVLRSGTRLLLL